MQKEMTSNIILLAFTNPLFVIYSIGSVTLTYLSMMVDNSFILVLSTLGGFVLWFVTYRKAVATKDKEISAAKKMDNDAITAAYEAKMKILEFKKEIGDESISEEEILKIFNELKEEKK